MTRDAQKRLSEDEIDIFQGFLGAGTLDFEILFIGVELGLHEDTMECVKGVIDFISTESQPINKRGRLSFLNSYKIIPSRNWFDGKVEGMTYRFLLDIIQKLYKDFSEENVHNYFHEKVLALEVNFMSSKNITNKAFENLYGISRKKFYKKYPLEKRKSDLKKLIEFARQRNKIVIIYTGDDLLGIVDDSFIDYGRSINENLKFLGKGNNIFVTNHPIGLRWLGSRGKKSIYKIVIDKIAKIINSKFR